MLQKKRRGRPRNSDSPKIVAANNTVARTIHTLSCWGFPQRSRKGSDGNDAPGVYEVVGLAAKKIRSDHAGRALGPDRIEELYEAWFAAETKHRHSKEMWPLMKRSRYLKESLRERMPSSTSGLGVHELAERLLENNGFWVSTPPVLPNGDLVLSPRERERKGALNDKAVDGIVRGLTRLWVEKYGPVDPDKADFLRQFFTRCLGIGYRADLLGDAPDSLKNGVEK